MDNLMLLAQRHLELGEYEKAAKIYKDILTKDPCNAEAYNKLGIILVRQGNKQEAKAHFIKAFKLNPQLSSAVSNLGNIFFEEGDLSKAKEYYERAIDLDPDNPVPHNNLAVIYKKTGDINKYVKYYKKSLELSIKDASRSGGIPFWPRQKTKKGIKKYLFMASIWILAIVIIFYLLTSFAR